MVHHDEPIPIPIKRQAEICFDLKNPLPHGVGLGSPHTFIDIEPVGRIPHRDDGGSKLREHVGRDVIGGSMGAINDHTNPVEIHTGCNRAFTKFDIPPRGILKALGPTDSRRIHRRHRLINLGLNLMFDFIRKLETIGSKNLMPLSKYGLCDALMTMPASARKVRVR